MTKVKVLLTDGRTDGQTDGQSDYYRAPAISGALTRPQGLFCRNGLLPLTLWYCPSKSDTAVLNHPVNTQNDCELLFPDRRAIFNHKTCYRDYYKLKYISHGISQVAPCKPKGRRSRGLICHAIWIVACNILFIIYLSGFNKNEILRHFAML
jgi:hypothetical protein